MRTTLLEKQHQKCLCALEMIANCKKYIANLSINANKKDAYTNVFGYKWYTDQVDKYNKILPRLEQYYINQVTKIFQYHDKP